MKTEIIHWATNQESIRALLLVGSRARGENHDRLSDLDIVVFTTNPTEFTINNDWIATIKEPWITLPESIQYKAQDYPTRLVIFSGGDKVDFTFFTMDVLEDLVKAKSLPLEFNLGYQILLDKDGLAAKMAKPAIRDFEVTKPSEQQYLAIIEEFWFEACHVAKYAKREDLWPLKFRDSWICHGPLLKMIEWDAQARRNWRFSPPPHGKDMSSWVDEEIWKELPACFAGFDVQESLKAFGKVVDLFRRLSKGVAAKLGYTYPEAVDQNITEFIASLGINAT